MIEAIELRLFNKILYKGTVDHIVGIEHNHDYNGYYAKVSDFLGGVAYVDLKDLDPVPLTPDWLRKCGFVNIGTDQLGGWHNYRKEMPMLHSVSIWHGRGGFQFTYDGSVKFIHHLHQLQNLFLDLTGEELDIKETV